MRLRERIAKLEARLAVELAPRKRAVPDWLQTVLEAQGFVFDVFGQVISAPDHRTQLSAEAQDDQDAPK